MDHSNDTTYQKRTKSTRTRLFRKIWDSLEVAEVPKNLGWLCSHTVRVNQAFNQLLKDADLGTLTGIYRTQLGEIISQDSKREKNDVIRLELEDHGQKRVFYLKRYWNREFSKIWKRATRGALVGRSVVRAEYEAMERLGELGIRIPNLVAYGEQRFCAGVVNSFIMTEEIPKAIGVDYVVGPWMEEQPKAMRNIHKETLLKETARCLKIMHAHGFEHHDLFLRNMMISGESMSDLYILDCPRAQTWPSFIMRWRRVHDLATLDSATSACLRPTQRMRFMHLYLGRDRLTPEDKLLVRKVLSLAEPMRQRQVARLDRSIPVGKDGNIISGCTSAQRSFHYTLSANILIATDDSLIMKRKWPYLLITSFAILVLMIFSPPVQRTLEIRSETRKWNEKWVDRVAVDSTQKVAQGGSIAPNDIAHDFVFTLAKSPWRINETLIVEKGAILSIEPGVELIVVPLVDIQIFGELLAKGTQEQPIYIHSQTPEVKSAWAGVFFRSDAASKLEFVTFENSLYGARGVFSLVNWTNCTFRNVREVCSSFRSDFSFDDCLIDYRAYQGSGNINVMKFYKGSARIEGSAFYCPNSDYKVDAIDVDYVDEAIIRGNRFVGDRCINSDAIDMGHGTRALVENNLIVGFIDKGVSVGEKAHAMISNNVIINCGMGVGIKDSATATISNTTFLGNIHAIECYEKVLGLGGGQAEVDHCVIVSCMEEPVLVDSFSKAEFTETLCDQKRLDGVGNIHGAVEFIDDAGGDYTIKALFDSSGTPLGEKHFKLGATI